MNEGNPLLSGPISVTCPTCRRGPGSECDQSRGYGSMDGMHASRVRLATEGRARDLNSSTVDSERDEYYKAARKRPTRGHR